MGSTTLRVVLSGTIAFPASFWTLGEIPLGRVALEVFNLLIFSRTDRLEMTFEDVLVVGKTRGTL